MRIFFSIVGICFVWFISTFYVSGHVLTPLLPGDVLIEQTGNSIYLPFLTSIIAGTLVVGSIFLMRKIFPVLSKAPIIIFGTLSIVVVAFIWYGYLLRTKLYVCNGEHQSSLDTLTAQSQTVLANHKGGCMQSYAVLTEWNLCIAKADEVVPVPFQRMLGSIVSGGMMFFREKTKDIDMLKREHDERCEGYTELLFYPPDTE